MRTMRCALLTAAICVVGMGKLWALDGNDIAQMLQHGVDQTIIINMVQEQKLSRPLTAAEIIALNNLGASVNLLVLVTRADAVADPDADDDDDDDAYNAQTVDPSASPIYLNPDGTVAGSSSSTVYVDPTYGTTTYADPTYGTTYVDPSYGTTTYVDPTYGTPTYIDPNAGAVITSPPTVYYDTTPQYYYYDTTPQSSSSSGIGAIADIFDFWLGSGDHFGPPPRRDWDDHGRGWDHDRRGPPRDGRPPPRPHGGNQPPPPPGGQKPPGGQRPPGGQTPPGGQRPPGGQKSPAPQPPPPAQKPTLPNAAGPVMRPPPQKIPALINEKKADEEKNVVRQKNRAPIRVIR